MNSHDILFGLAAILVLGVTAQWIAWRIRIPSILVLLVTGFAAGPLTGFLNPDLLFGDLLFPLVSLAVALILFEGGMTLQLRETAEVRSTIVKLVLLGGTVTWLLAAGAAHLLFGLSPIIALLLGAILMVTGPTVILPLLRHVRPEGRLSAILKWEGIAIDPYGALMAVLLFEIALAGAERSGAAVLAVGVLKTVVFGGLIGAAAAALLILLLRRHWVPDFLDEAVALALVIGSTLLSNAIQEEAGLLSATLMGVVLANQRYVAVRHIIDFKENLTVLLLATLFITLAARLPLESLGQLGWSTVAFLAILILVVRPLSVMVSTAGNDFRARDRVFLSAMAPRGIVAASVASVFAIRLTDLGITEAAILVPITFTVIVVTVTVYGLTSRPLAQSLGLAQRAPQGLLFVGAQPWVRQLAVCLTGLDIRTCLIDSNEANVSWARAAGLSVHHGNAVSEFVTDNLDLNGIGRLLAVTSNEEANALAALHFVEIFGRSEVYQCALTPPRADDVDSEPPRHLRGRLLFDGALTNDRIARRVASGARFESLTLADDLDFARYEERFGDRATPLFVLNPAGHLTVLADRWRETFTPAPGDTLIHLLDPAT